MPRCDAGGYVVCIAIGMSELSKKQWIGLMLCCAMVVHKDVGCDAAMPHVFLCKSVH